MVYTIENEFLKVSVETLGAQLKSIKSKVTDIEYLWQGDKNYWTGRAYNLFPYVGRFAKGKYVVENKEFSMDRHGFARGTEFALCQKTAESMTFCISATDKTKEIYPFEFIFSIKYTLCGKGLKVTYNVKNVGNNKMYFGLGGHPGFNVPFNGGKFEDYYLEFEKDCNPTQIILDDDGLVSKDREGYTLKDGKKIGLYHSMFDRDAVVLTDVCRSVYLKDPNGERSIKVDFPDMSYLGFWHMPKTDAPYVCIEPWMTLPSNAGEPEVLETKENVGVVESGKEFITDMIISINE